MNLEQLLVSRIMTPNPRDSFVVERSFPITYFGRLDTAKVVTIGINPSVREFCDQRKPAQILIGSKKRVLDRESIGIADRDIPTTADAVKVVDSYSDYFDTGRHLDWFDKMQKWALEPLGVSYLRGNVAHLDLVQWATSPVWRQLPAEIKSKLIEADSPFLEDQLRIAKPNLILFNGGTVVATMRESGYFRETETGVIPGAAPFKYFIGECGDARAIGWSINIQSQHDTGNSAKKALSNWLVENASL